MRRRISLILTILAILLWAGSLLLSRFTIGFYGLIESYHYTYFVALGLLSVASFMLWFSNEGHGRLLCLQLCLFIIMLWLTPILIGANPVSSVWNYAIYFPNSADIVQSGHINPTLHFDVYSVVSLQNWPGVFSLEAAIMKITGASTADFMALYSPLVMQFLILPPLYIFFKNTINHPNHRWAACWFFFLANWTSQLYFCSQGLGMLFLITLLALLSRTAFWQNEAPSVGQQFSVILVLAGLAITHLLTSIVAFLSVAALWVTRQIRGLNLTVLAGVLVAFWSIYGAANQLQISVPVYVERAFHLEMILQLAALGVAGTASRSLESVAFVRYIFTAAIATMALMGFLLSLKFRDKTDFPVLALFIPAFLVLFSMLYSGEFWIRTFLFALLPLSYFAVKMLRHKASALLMCALLLALLPFNIIANYGYAATDNEPPAEGAYWHFAVEDDLPGDVLGGTRIYYQDFTYSKFYLLKAVWKDGLFVMRDASNTRVQYVHVGATDQANYAFNLSDSTSVTQTQNELEGSLYYSLIYANPDVNLYFHQY